MANGATLPKGAVPGGTGSKGAGGSDLRKLITPAVIVLILGVLGYFVWSAMDSRTGVERPKAPNTQIDLLPPPPPPPPPPPEEVPPEPVESPTPDPTPSPAPEPTPEAPAPMQIDGPATAGSDAFGMTSGKGGGMGAPGSTGNCVGPNCGKAASGVGAFNDRFYRGYLSSALQAALRRDKAINRDRFSVTVLIWVDKNGRVSRADMVQGSGNAELDQRVLTSLRSVSALRPPQEGVKFPQRTLVRGTI